MLKSTSDATDTTPLTVHYRPSSTPQSPATFSIGYFDMGGKAEALRLCAYYCQAPFDDVRYSREMFRAKKAANDLPFGQMPMLSLTTASSASPVFIPQTNAILRTIARSSSNTTCYPLSNVAHCGAIDAILDLDADMFTGMLVHNYKERFGFDYLNEPSAADDLKKVRENLASRVLPQHLSNLEKMVGANGWLGGDWATPTIADFNWAPRLKYLLTALPDEGSADLLKPCSKLQAFVEAFYALPEVVAYYS